MAAAPKVGFVSLGCPKALVDSEGILTRLRAEGYAITPSYDGADLVVVNTCGFIESAVRESLDAIGEALEENGRVIVTGCLGAKGDIVRQTHPKVLAVTGPHALEDVMTAVHEHLPKPHDPFADLVPPHGIKLTPRHVLHHPVPARRSGEPADRRRDAGGGKFGESGREGAAGDFSGHERLRRGPQVPHGFLGRTAAQGAHGRFGGGPRRIGRLGAAPLRLSLSPRRR